MIILIIGFLSDYYQVTFINDIRLGLKVWPKYSIFDTWRVARTDQIFFIIQVRKMKINEENREIYVKENKCHLQTVIKQWKYTYTDH